MVYWMKNQLHKNCTIDKLGEGLNHGGAEGNRTLDLLNAIYLLRISSLCIVFSVDRHSLTNQDMRGNHFTWCCTFLFPVCCTISAQIDRAGPPGGDRKYGDPIHWLSRTLRHTKGVKQFILWVWFPDHLLEFILCLSDSRVEIFEWNLQNW